MEPVTLIAALAGLGRLLYDIWNKGTAEECIKDAETSPTLTTGDAKHEYVKLMVNKHIEDYDIIGERPILKDLTDEAIEYIKDEARKQLDARIKATVDNMFNKGE